MEANERLQKRVEPEPRQSLFKSGRPNTSQPPLGFNAAEQFVDVRPGSGHEFKSPATGDLRGQCPGLNAAANHGFLPHNGLVTTEQTITGLGEAYNMSPDLSLFLAIVSIALQNLRAGDPLTETWSIDSGFPAAIPLLFGKPSGIAGTHSQYESDASIFRGDAYLNGGNVGVFQMRSWEHFYNMGEEYTLDMATQITRWSIMNNPYYFSAPFAGFVAPAPHNFVINFMSNRSAENPGGVLNREVLKSFFAVTGEPGSFVHNRGQKHIPENWYKRPALNAYNIPEVLADVFDNNAMHPGIVRFGGNTGTVNSFAGVDITDLTGGVFTLADLADGNNGACFLLQASLQGLPDASDLLLGAVGSILGWATEQLGPLISKFGCPQLATFNQAFFKQFPGASYKARGQ
ncbi:Chloroperoxidase [Rhexocercosporidium sp. MPI-PUGE-AT-0058]|nr:Chloroperoxidase [Rhexocercosporidium sp. MPI-PUGE-AT-0058]